MQLQRVTEEAIADLRAEKMRSLHVPLLPSFHLHLATHADAYAVIDGKATVGYVLLLFDRHEGHDHVTLIEGYLTSPFRDRYEDLVSLVQDEAEPRAYLARSDDCTFETALISHGFTMEVSLAVMVARAALPAGPANGLGLVPMDYPHLRVAQALFAHVRTPDQAPSVAELERELDDDRIWVLTHKNQPVGLVVQEEARAEQYCLLDIIAPHLPDDQQVWALLETGKRLELEGKVSAAAIDPHDPRKIAVFRQAGFYTAANYLIFYDPEAGRLQVPMISREELWDLIESGEEFHLLDVMGEDHWQRGHLPGAEWADFRGLTRQARERYEPDERIVVYCNDYT